MSRAYRARNSNTKQAFTLIELLVVIAIIAILAAILFPVFAAAKRSAKVSVDVSNTKQLALAIQMYANDYDDVWPMTIQGLSTGCNGSWYGANEYVGILQMTYPYVKNVDIYWSALDPKPGNLATPMVPDPVNGIRTGTWGWWTKEETILPNNVALNIWDGGCADIMPRSVTAVDFPSDLGIFIPVVGPIPGLATTDNNPNDGMVDIDPWFNSCVGNFNNSGILSSNGFGWPPVYAAFVQHGNSLPVAYGDGHAKSIKQDKFFQDTNNNCYYDVGINSTNSWFYESGNVSKFWGFYLQGWPINS